MRRTLTLLSAAGTLLAMCSCSVARNIPPRDATAAAASDRERFAQFDTPRGQPVLGYTSIYGLYHDLRGRARLEGDTMVFTCPETREGPLTLARPALTVRVAVAEIASVRSTSEDSGSSTLFAAALVGGVAGAAVAIWYLSQHAIIIR